MATPVELGAGSVSGAMRRATAPRAVKLLGVGPRQVRVIASDATPDRMGDILEPYGVRLEEYRRNPIVLAQHDSNQPIGRCSHIAVDNNQVVALIEFPAEGTSDRADEYLRLMKAGIIGAVSVGFIPNAWEPIKGAGLRFTDWTMLELSCVSVPANPSSLVTERGKYRADGNDEMRALREEIAKLRSRAQEPCKPREPEPPLTRDQVRLEVDLMRARSGVKRIDPRVIAAQAAFRLRGW
jgi:HK97 family phage prohead protease